MLHVSERLEASQISGRAPSAVLVLPFDQRQRSRFRATLQFGGDVAVHLPRGTVLRGGDFLRADDGTLIELRAAPEPVSTVTSPDPVQLARAAYHLGNRHVLLQVGEGWLRYQHDHVLDEMVRALGLPVHFERAPFEPEGGAYHGGHHHHDDDDAPHAHGHAHHGHAAHA